MTPGAKGRYLGQFRPEFSRLHRDRDLYWVVPFGAPLILGLVGRRFVGVTTTIQYLRDRHGFDVYTLGGELRRLAEEQGVPVVHRRYLQDFGDELRAESRDPGFLARRVLRRIRADRLTAPRWRVPRSIVIGGIKNPTELAVLSRVRGFCLVEVVTEDVGDPPVRFRRALDQGRLREEYEGERARRSQVQAGQHSTPPFEDLSASDKRAYFARLDEQHAQGHPGRWPDPYRGAPADVVAADPDRQTLLNNTDKHDDLHRAIDELLGRLRPSEQIVHH